MGTSSYWNIKCITLRFWTPPLVLKFKCKFWSVLSSILNSPDNLLQCVMKLQYVYLLIHVQFWFICVCTSVCGVWVCTCVGNSPLLTKGSLEAFIDVAFREMKHWRGNLSGSLKCHQFHCSFLFKANYNVPTLEKKCSKRGDGAAGKSCQLSCSSVGGYPQSAVKWAGLNMSLLRAVHNDSLEDPISKTWTVNQTVTYNCDQPTNVSCAVGGAVSPDVTVCKCVGCRRMFESSESVVVGSWILMRSLYISNAK